MEYRQFIYTPKKGLKLSSVNQDSYQAILAMVNEVVSLATGYKIEQISSDIDCRQERFLSITYRKADEQKPEHPGRFASESLHWTAYFKDSETGNAIAEYSNCGDINYHDMDLPWKEFFKGDTPIDILCRKADVSGFPYDVIVEEVIYSWDPGYEKMTARELLHLSGLMCDDNPTLFPSYRRWFERYENIISEGKVKSSLSKSLTRKLSRLMKECVDIADNDITYAFGLFCWSRGVKPENAAAYIALAS